MPNWYHYLRNTLGFIGLFLTIPITFWVQASWLYWPYVLIAFLSCFSCGIAASIMHDYVRGVYD